jgi:hypothetical protein
MPTAHEVASELRRIADALDKEPEVTFKRPLLFFFPDTKEEFLTQARILPRPLKKIVDSRDYALQSPDESAVWLRAKISRSEVCTLVEPAKPAVYDCGPLLSQEEEDSLTEA